MITVVSCIISGIFSVLVVAIPLGYQHRKDRERQDNALYESMKCSLRNDILDIYMNCKGSKKISLYQKQAVHYSHEQYKSLGGNSFVDEICKEMNTWETTE